MSPTVFETLGMTEDGFLRILVGDVGGEVKCGPDQAVWEEAVRTYLASVDAAPEALRPKRLSPPMFDLRKPPAKLTIESILRALKLAPIPPQAAIDRAIALIDEIFDYRGVRTTHASMETGYPATADADGIHLVLRLIIWDVDGEKQSVRDIKEQPCRMAPLAAAADPDRLAAYVRGWMRALEGFLTTHWQASEELMPNDLVAPDVLDLRAATEDEFAAAIARRLKI